MWLTGHDPVSGEERGHQRLSPDADLVLDGTLKSPEVAQHCGPLASRARGRV